MNFPYLGETRDLNDETRTSADGSFIQLSDGITHYEIGGPSMGFPVILVHGFSVPYYIFDPVFDFLTASGCRVLRYDLYGRGWSDRPDLTYNLDLFVRQLHDLALTLNIAPPFALIGLSMGGPVTAAFTLRYPDLVSRYVLIDPAGTRATELGWLGSVIKPVIGEIVLGLFGSSRLVKNIASDFFDPSLIEQFQTRYQVQIEFCGFKRAILSTVRSGMLGDFSHIYHQLGGLAKPVLLIWGRHDTTIPFSHSQDLLRFLPHARFHIVEKASHIPHYEQPDEVNPLLLQFLSE